MVTGSHLNWIHPCKDVKHIVEWLVKAFLLCKSYDLDPTGKIFCKTQSEIVLTQRCSEWSLYRMDHKNKKQVKMSTCTYIHTLLSPPQGGFSGTINEITNYNT